MGKSKFDPETLQADTHLQIGGSLGSVATPKAVHRQIIADRTADDMQAAAEATTASGIESSAPRYGAFICGEGLDQASPETVAAIASVLEAGAKQLEEQAHSQRQGTQIS